MEVAKGGRISAVGTAFTWMIFVATLTHEGLLAKLLVTV